MLHFETVRSNGKTKKKRKEEGTPVVGRDLSSPFIVSYGSEQSTHIDLPGKRSPLIDMCALPEPLLLPTGTVAIYMCNIVEILHIFQLVVPPN